MAKSVGKTFREVNTLCLSNPLGKERYNLPFGEDVGFWVVSPQVRTLTHLFEGVTV